MYAQSWSCRCLSSSCFSSYIILVAANLSIPAAKREEFREKYGIEWDLAASEKKLLNLAQFQEKFPGMSMADIEVKWRAGPTMKLAPGNYVSKLT